MNRCVVRGLLLCIAVGAWSTAGAAALPLYMKVVGSKQGQIRGEVTTPGWEDWVGGLGFHYAVTSPVGAAGQAAGKRQHSAVVVTKRLDRASPLLFSALAGDEVLPSVELRFVRGAQAGTQVAFFTIKLTNARVVSIEQRVEPPGLPGDQGAGDPREDVSFVFEKIELTFADGGITAMDDWGAAAASSTLNVPVIRRRATP